MAQNVDLALLGLTEEQQNQVLQVLLKDTHSVFYRAVEELVMNRYKTLVASVNTKNRDRVPIGEKLTAEAQRKLGDMYPELDIIFKNSNVGSHAFAAASRRLETEILVQRCGDGPIVDIGGAYHFHMMKGRTNVHSCCPILNATDSQRETVRLAILQNVAGKHKHMQKSFELFASNRSAIVCHNDASVCQLKAPVAMMVHSNYDIPLEKLAQICVDRDINIVHGSFIFHPDIITKESGYIADLGCYFEKKNEAVLFGANAYGLPLVRNRTFINFSFKGDSSLGYRHDYFEYLRYVTQGAINYSGVQFILELMENRCGVQFFRLTKCCDGNFSGSRIFHRIWLPETKDLVVNTFKYEYTTNSNKRLVPFSFQAPKDMIEKAKEYAQDLKEKDFTYENVYGWVRTLNNKYIINGVSMTVPDRILADLLFDLALAVYLWAFKKKYEISVINREIINNMKDQRKYFEGGIRSTFAAAINGLRSENDFFEFYYNWLDSMLSLSKSYDISFEEPVRFLTYEEVVGGWCRSVYENFDEGDFSVKLQVSALEQEELDLEAKIFKNRFMHKQSLALFDLEVEMTSFMKNYSHLLCTLVPEEEEEVFSDASSDLFSEESVVSVPTTVSPSCSSPVVEVFVDETDVRDVEFQPDYESLFGTHLHLELDVDKHAIARNAMREYLEFSRSYDAHLAKKFKSEYDGLSHLFANRRIDELKAGSDDWGVYDLVDQRWLLEPRDKSDHAFCFDGEKFVAFKNKSEEGGKIKIVNTTARLVLVSKESRLMLQRRVYKALSKYDISTFTMPDMTLVEGVPGCGKTTYVIDNHKRQVDLVLTTGADAATSLRIRVGQGQKKFYRTADSYLMNSDAKHERVFFDEGLMVHAGALFFVALISGCKTMQILGDRAQLPFINRLQDVNLRYSSFDFPISKVMNESSRCPLDVAASFFNSYSSGFFTSSPVTESLSYEHIISVANVKLEEGVKYLTLSQAEKTTLQQKGFDVNTVHEVQGGTFKRVVLVRVNPLPAPVYDSDPHILVGLTRHTESLRYLSVVKDKTSDLILRSKILDLGVSRANKKQRVVAPSGFLGVVEETPVEGRPPCIEIFNSPVKKEQENFCTSIKTDIASAVNLVNGSVNYANSTCFQNNFISLSSAVAVTPTAVSRGGSVTDLQMMFDYYLPGNSLVSEKFDWHLVENSDLTMNLSDCSIDFTKSYKKPGVSETFLEPLLRTHQPDLRKPSQRQTLLAVLKRNMNVPDIGKVIDEEDIADRMVNRFFEAYMVDKDLDFSDDPIDLTNFNLEQWLSTQKESVLGQIKALFPVEMQAVDQYIHMIKREVKPKLDLTIQAEYQSLQTIVYHNKEINAVFGALFKVIKDRLLSNLKPNVCIYADMTPADLGKLFDNFLNLDDLELLLKILELDCSKFDKSQGKLFWLFQQKFWKRMGLGVDFAEIWGEGHRKTFVTDFINGVRMLINYQRKSGDTTTYLGNTIVVMAMIAFLYAVEEALLSVFGGDDSLVLFNGATLLDKTEDFAGYFSMETKILRNSHFYFCSKFIVPTINGFKVVGDPLKLITRLGRRDVRDYQHLYEYFVSLNDNFKDLKDASCYDYLCRALAQRYKKEESFYSALVTLKCYMSDFKGFKTLFVKSE